MNITGEELKKIHQQVVFLEKAIYIEENNFNIFEQGTVIPSGSSENVIGLIYRIIKSPEPLKNLKAYQTLKTSPDFKQDEIYTCKDNKYTLQILRRIQHVIASIPIPQLERQQIEQRLEQFGEYSINNQECNAKIQLDYYINLEKRIFLELYHSIFSNNENKILSNGLTMIENIYKIITNPDNLEECSEYLVLKTFIDTFDREEPRIHVLENNESIEYQLKKMFKGFIPVAEKIG